MLKIASKMFCKTTIKTLLKTTTKTTPQKSYAFSLIELAVVILIIGIVITGLVVANAVIKNSRITTAQSLTESSPVNGITENALWLESSLEKSFAATESEDKSSVSSWNDIKNSSTVKNNASKVDVSGNSPKYSNTINHIHAIKFAGNNAGSTTPNAGYFNVDGSFLNNTNYTIFVVEKRQSANSNNYFLGDSANNSNNQSLLLGYNSDASVIHSQSGTTLTNASTASVDSYANYNDKPRIFTFKFDTTSGSKTYINGTLSGENTTNLAPLTNVNLLSIGKGYSGEIGEVIAFTRSLKTDEKKAVEDYLSKKWSIKLTGNSVASCTDGVITEKGCKQTCPFTVVGVTKTSASEGFSGSLICDATGYAGGTTKQIFTCTNGILNPPPSQTPNICITAGETTGGSNGADVCASGYALISGTCQQVCTLNVTGISNRTVTRDSTSATCDFGYIGTISYTCGNNGISGVSGSCVVAPMNCAGGTESDITVSGVSYKVHKFNSSGQLKCASGGNAEVLVVGGGGGGGGGDGGGGGGGGVLSSSEYLISDSTLTITVGAGGDGSVVVANDIPSVLSTAGGDSSISGTASGTIKAGGGGYGGGENHNCYRTYNIYCDQHSQLHSSVLKKDGDGGSGGSGGGGGAGNIRSVGGTANGFGVGFAGGINGGLAGGGGGGAGGPGGAAENGGKGGVGIESIITGSSSFYGGGGGGSNRSSSSFTGGNGGGGNGGRGGSGNGNAGSVNTGGGGGGGIDQNGSGGNGGSGIVIIRYAK